MKIRRDGRGLMTISPTTAAIVNGDVDLSEWDMEELERGRRRDRRGGFGGKAPQVVASAVHAEIVKRKMSRAYGLLKESTVKAVEVLVEVAEDKDAESAIRVKALWEAYGAARSEMSRSSANGVLGTSTKVPVDRSPAGSPCQ